MQLIKSRNHFFLCVTNNLYSGSNGHYVDDVNTVEEIYKGCSTFEVNTPEEGLCTSIKDIVNDGTPVDFETCKQFCTGEEDCNKDHININIPPPTPKNHSCYTCQYTMDHMGYQIGLGDPLCFSNNPSSDTNQECPNENDVCLTDMLVDWFAKGDQNIHVNRRCGHRPTNPGGKQCLEERKDQNYFKDCNQYCENYACNTDIDGVIALFDSGVDRNCYNCQYGFDNYGNVKPNSNKNCHNEDVSETIETLYCPKYLNAACFTSTTWESTSTGLIANEDYKECFRMAFVFWLGLFSSRLGVPVQPRLSRSLENINEKINLKFEI